MQQAATYSGVDNNGVGTIRLQVPRPPLLVTVWDSHTHTKKQLEVSGTKIVVMALVDEICAHLQTTSIQAARDRFSQMSASQLPDELSGKSAVRSSRLNLS